MKERCLNNLERSFIEKKTSEIKTIFQPERSTCPKTGRCSSTTL